VVQRGPWRAAGTKEWDLVDFQAQSERQRDRRAPGRGEEGVGAAALRSHETSSAGFKPHDCQTFAVKGHPFGLNISIEDRRALIAFLKTL
jgi:hypothetical protein